MDLLMPLGFAVDTSHTQGCSLLLTPGQKKDESFPAAHCAAKGSELNLYK